jgi:Na+-translocating ferredoxin:NAD+ oxidoreductase subunit C
MAADDKQYLYEDDLPDSATNLWHFHGGLHLPGHKHLSSDQPIAACAPVERYVIPLQQHIGVIGDLLVAKGERVLKGQMLTRPKNLISAAVHAPVSGVIEDIALRPFPHPSGISGPCITLLNDHEDEWVKREPVAENYTHMSSHELRGIIRDAGIVGLGGATFPSAVKETEIGIDTLIINGVECEPYITCDDRLMRERAAGILEGSRIVAHIVKAKACIIAIEDNKPEAIEAMGAALREEDTGLIHVKAVPTLYPSGGERQLIEVLTGEEVPSNGLPSDIHVLCHNVATCYAIYRAVFEGEPLISRIVTVTGHGITQPRNLEVPIGTPINACIEQCGGYRDDAVSLIMGGPMMGVTLDNDSLPVIKACNCLLVTTADDLSLPSSTSHMPCIRCGRCVDVCPAKLLPQQLFWYSASRNLDRAIEYSLFDCIECGCCAYVCPSKIPLVQYYRYAKSEIWEQERQRKKADIARVRHEQKVERLEKQQRERDERLRKKRDALKKNKVGRNVELEKKKATIAEALARVQQKKATSKVEPKNTDQLTPEQQQQIEEADQRRAGINKNQPADDADKGNP